MDCCCCCPRSSTKKKKSEASNPTNEDKSDHPNQSNAETSNVNQDMETDQRNYELDNSTAIDPEIRLAPRTFTYQEMADATENFKDGHLLGEGGFGKVYKGHLRSTNEVVAIKKLNLNGVQGNSEFMVELMTLCGADHPNLVKLLGYCIEGEQRIVVYEFMPLGSLDAHLHDLTEDQMPLDWNTRMKIAAGAAKGLEYLHDKLNPPIIYRDLKSANILLGEDYHPKLSDFGLAKVGPTGDKTHVSTRVIMGTEGYCAPEYASTGHLTFKSDIYSFGVTLLEIITGRKAMDDTKSSEEKNLAVWAKPLLKDETNFEQMVDPALNGVYIKRDLNKALAITALCLHDESKLRPVVSVIVEALDRLDGRGYYVSTRSDGASSSRSQNAESSSRNE